MMSPTSKAARLWWSVTYLLFALAGIVAFFTPLRTIEGALVRILVYSWAAFMTFGGCFSLGGKLRKAWAGELIGLPALSAANYVLGAILVMQGATIGSILFGGIFVGMGTAFVGRWTELWHLSRRNIGGEQ